MFNGSIVLIQMFGRFRRESDKFLGREFCLSFSVKVGDATRGSGGEYRVARYRDVAKQMTIGFSRTRVAWFPR